MAADPGTGLSRLNDCFGDVEVQTRGYYKDSGSTGPGSCLTDNRVLQPNPVYTYGDWGATTNQSEAIAQARFVVWASNQNGVSPQSGEISHNVQWEVVIRNDPGAGRIDVAVDQSDSIGMVEVKNTWDSSVQAAKEQLDRYVDHWNQQPASFPATYYDLDGYTEAYSERLKK